MPTYDYECKKCGHTFETFQSMSEDPLEKCPSCAKNGLKRLIGGGLGVIFKGSGFYVTDSRGGAKSAGTATKKSEDSPSKSTGDSSSDTPSTTKSEPSTSSTKPSKTDSPGSGPKAAT